MLTLFGSPQKYCDGVNRRSFLKIGAFAFGATNLTLADIFRAEASQKQTSPKAVINIFLGGGPPHQDTFDLKPEAPSEIRGEFKPISTAVNGIQIGECFPEIAKRMNDYAIIRSIVGSTGGHDAIQCTTGKPPRANANIGGWPSMGSLLSKVLGPGDPSVPPFVGLAAKTAHLPWSDCGGPGFLGAPYAAFKPEGPDLANMKLSTINQQSLGDRKELLTSFDNLRREIDASGNIRGMDAASERALNVLTSSKLLDALDLSKEPESSRKRYGDGKPYQFQYDGAPTVNDQVLLARRLVEAGVRCVTLSFGRWDSHSKNFDLVRDHGRKLDQALSALTDDLKQRGMLNDVVVIAWGEMGRTPRINKEAGRDHWPQVCSAILAGGALRTGQVVGSTDRLGENAKDRPVTHSEVFATIYKAIGIDPDSTMVLDPTGRPTHIVESQVIRELV
ncbi:DUF1501 domain-containing protein [Telmatocola sphagniphila]|uniref:DUF1501 domain-containing protein n=1 Tax=Telmatocola sphagniphila TaxID=1123043 RepID=A0A8E6B2A2_9BACT|nr:DUF1501 domain-containing protein [Telmatocola sphagniphila]QVL29949.1 DUF1501 domain-containing protein [Telmatocola sphagniphila]